VARDATGRCVTAAGRGPAGAVVLCPVRGGVGRPVSGRRACLSGTGSVATGLHPASGWGLRSGRSWGPIIPYEKGFNKYYKANVVLTSIH
jgi:hypothetical protein